MDKISLTGFGSVALTVGAAGALLNLPVGRTLPGIATTSALVIAIVAASDVVESYLSYGASSISSQ